MFIQSRYEFVLYLVVVILKKNVKKKKPFNENWKNKMGLFTIVNTDSNKIKVVWDTFIM